MKGGMAAWAMLAEMREACASREKKQAGDKW
jgi:hypothetical protein